ncbi:IclR family transcriptional regulator [Rhodococcus koreensis]
MRASSTSTLESASNALRLLKLIGVNGTVTVSEASRELGVGKSTAHRLLMTLVAENFAVRDEASRRYYVGPAAVAAGLSTIWDFDIRRRTTAPLRRLAETIGETTKLLVLDGPYARVLDAAETRHSLRLGSSLGKILPANATAGGKLLLTGHSEESLKKRFGGRLPSLTPRTICDWEYLAVELGIIRQRGWSSSEGESTPRVNGIAVPVWGQGGWMIGALAVAAPEERLTRSARLEILGQLLPVSRHLSGVMSAPITNDRSPARQATDARGGATLRPTG